MNIAPVARVAPPTAQPAQEIRSLWRSFIAWLTNLFFPHRKTQRMLKELMPKLTRHIDALSLKVDALAPISLQPVLDAIAAQKFPVPDQAEQANRLTTLIRRVDALAQQQQAGFEAQKGIFADILKTAFAPFVEHAKRAQNDANNDRAATAARLDALLSRPESDNPPGHKHIASSLIKRLEEMEMRIQDMHAQHTELLSQVKHIVSHPIVTETRVIKTSTPKSKPRHDVLKDHESNI